MGPCDDSRFGGYFRGLIISKSFCLCSGINSLTPTTKPKPKKERSRKERLGFGHVDDRIWNAGCEVSGFEWTVYMLHWDGLTSRVAMVESTSEHL